MSHDSRIGATGATGSSSPSEAWLFAQALLGNSVPSHRTDQAEERAERERLEWLAGISDRHADELRRLQSAKAEARRQRAQLEWLAGISTRHEEELHRVQAVEAEIRQAQARHERFVRETRLREAEWHEADHPRQSKGVPTGGQWVARGGGSASGGSAGSADRRRSLFDKFRQRNSQIAELTGVVTPGMIRANRLTADIESAVRLPGEVARAAAAGTVTGGKAVVNGFATAVKDVATLGLNPGQLELIGVTKEDRARGYDTAVAITTGSGQVLIAVGTGGIVSALSKGGSVARAASGALIAFDAAGNAVGVVQGVYDASKNGVTVANGVQVAASALGLAANVKAARGVGRAIQAGRLAEIDEFVKKLPRTATPTRTPADLYEIKHTGPYNYELSGGGAKFKIDGYRGSTILESKHVNKPKSSPYVPGSSCPPGLRAKILAEARGRLTKAATIIKSGSTPFKSVEIVTNTQASKKLFEEMLKEIGLSGTVRLEP